MKADLPSVPFIELTMDQISLKIPNPKCQHLYWCSIDFIDWRYSQSYWYFQPLSWTSAPLTFSLVHLSPPLGFFPVWIKYRGTCIHTVCNRGGGDRGPLTDKHLPPSTFTGQFLHFGFGVFICRYLVHGSNQNTRHIFYKHLRIVDAVFKQKNISHFEWSKAGCGYKWPSLDDHKSISKNKLSSVASVCAL